MDRKNMLDVILDACIDDIASISKDQFERMHEKASKKIDMESVEKFIRQLPLNKADIDKLIEMLNEMEFITNGEFGYVTDKYYKAGFSDAVNIIFDALEEKKLWE